MTTETVKQSTPNAQKASPVQNSPAQKNAFEQGRGSPSGTQGRDQKSLGLQDLSGDLNNLKKDIEVVIKDATSYTSDELAQMKTKLYERFTAAQQYVTELRGQLSEQARKGATATDKYVHEKPWTAIGGGALAGLLLGFMLSRRT